jgi:hypothetical protein
VIATSGIIIQVAFMSDGTPHRFFDQAERDRQHALRRIQRHRTRSIAYWAMIPWLVSVAIVLAVFFRFR